MAPERVQKSIKKSAKQPRQCPHCMKWMLTDYNRHLKIHFEPEYICPFPGCGKGFHQQSNLKTHMNTHTGNRQHACPHSWIDENKVISPCSCVFRDGSALTRHRKEAHGFDPKHPEKLLAIQFKSSAEQIEDAEVYAMAATLAMSVPDARKELKRTREPRVTSHEVPAPVRAPKAPRLSPSSSVSSSASPASSSAFSSSSLPSTPGSSHFKAAIPPAKRASGSSSTDHYGNGAHASASAQGWHKQPQEQNFADVLGQPSILFQGQVPNQQYGMQQDFFVPALPPVVAQPEMNFGIQDWEFALSDPLAGLDMSMGMNGGIDMGMGIPSTLSYDMPPFPAQEPLSQPPMGWDNYFSAPSPSSTASSAPSPPYTGDFFDGFYQHYSA
ncbi:hypothetical protein OH77DRAFT_1522018 [Trametes cingulata]|nr:hypothetical protein OH77DRAFT_1522018 [Trametes cingulata]